MCQSPVESQGYAHVRSHPSGLFKQKTRVIFYREALCMGFPLSLPNYLSLPGGEGVGGGGRGSG